MTSKLRDGFTLVELLIVIAILGTLAVVVLIALNPVQQLARTRDGGRRSTVSQLGHAMEAYGTGRNGLYFAPAAGWITAMRTAGEIASVPQNPAYSAGGANCSTNTEGNFCYSSWGTGTNYTRFIVFARLESQAENSKCPAGTANGWAVYSSPNSGGGILCLGAGEPGDPGVNGYTGSTWLQ